MNDSVFWSDRYQKRYTPWNIFQAAPPLVSFFQKYPFKMPVGKMIVIGCGHGHDAAFFANQGFDVVGLDFAPEALSLAKKRYGNTVDWIEGNLFELAETFYQQFDYVLEHTCFCAISPPERNKYMDAISKLLKPNGIFLGLFWAFVDPDGPPWPTNEEELKSLFSPHFKMLELSRPLDSVQQRLNQEVLGYFKKV